MFLILTMIRIELCTFVVYSLAVLYVSSTFSSTFNDNIL